MRTVRLPLYPGAESAELKGGNMGLWFNKFPNQWRADEHGFPVFDPAGSTDRKSWLVRNFFKVRVGNNDEIRSYATRIHRLAARVESAITLGLKNVSRFVTGTGLQHPTGNGVAWHQTLGTPYLPGSGIKGMLSSFFHDNPERLNPGEFELIFGDEKQHSVGCFVFCDLVPLKPVQMAVEILTPHYRDYYQDGNVFPGDWNSPVPIQFLSVENGQEWLCCVFPTNRLDDSRVDFSQLTEKVAKAMIDAFVEIGVGAKTEIGWGVFERDNRILNDFLERAKRESMADTFESVQNPNDPQVIELEQATLEYFDENGNLLNENSKGEMRKRVFEFVQGHSGKLSNDAIAWLGKKIFDNDFNTFLRKKTEPKNKKLQQIRKIVREQLGINESEK